METCDYKRVILPQAESDIQETLDYIAEKLFNPTAAIKLMEDMEETMQSVSKFPYSRPQLKDKRLTLGADYRRADVNNFVLIYKVVEEAKEVRIMAAFYAPSDVVARLLNRI